MLRRVVEVLLLLVAASGGYRVWETGHERSQLVEECDRLNREVGELPVGDPAKVLFRAVETGEPLHYRWQVHLPANYTLSIKHSSGGFGGGTPDPEPRDFPAQFRLREEAGQLQTFTQVHGGSSKSSLGGTELADLIRAHPGEILVDRLGVADTAVIEPDQAAVVIRLSLPESLREAATKAHPGYYNKGRPLVLFEMKLDPPGAKP